MSRSAYSLKHSGKCASRSVRTGRGRSRSPGRRTSPADGNTPPRASAPRSVLRRPAPPALLLSSLPPNAEDGSRKGGLRGRRIDPSTLRTRRARRETSTWAANAVVSPRDSDMKQRTSVRHRADTATAVRSSGADVSARLRNRRASSTSASSGRDRRHIRQQQRQLTDEVLLSHHHRHQPIAPTSRGHDDADEQSGPESWDTAAGLALFSRDTGTGPSGCRRRKSVGVRLTTPQRARRPQASGVGQ